jgi:hypothetical protein
MVKIIFSAELLNKDSQGAIRAFTSLRTEKAVFIFEKSLKKWEEKMKEILN